DGATASLLGTTKRKDGSTQVTYNGWPLYYWWKDAKPGDTLGQNVGKVWFVVAPDGKPVQPPAPTPTSTQQPAAATPTPAPTPTPTPTPVPTAREIKVTATYPAFSPSMIEVKAGEKVRFVVTSTDMYHTFTVPDLGIDLQLDAGQTKSVEVTIPSGKAEIGFYCDPHRYDGMVGKLVVTASQPMSDVGAPTPTPSYDYGGGY
ncbi:MAG: cupredoxin domain-containing protein, partial [Chloroflexota bacterium]|nr:cupredoxin domain-containing protein [Chloroflexota bacterium]